MDIVSTYTSVIMNMNESILLKEQEEFLSFNKTPSIKAIYSYKYQKNILIEDELLFDMNGYLLNTRNNIPSFEKMMIKGVTNPNFTVSKIFYEPNQTFTLGQVIAWTRSIIPSQRAFAFLFFKKYLRHYHERDSIDLHKSILERLLNVHRLMDILEDCIHSSSTTVRQAAKSCIETFNTITHTN